MQRLFDKRCTFALAACICIVVACLHSYANGQAGGGKNRLAAQKKPMADDLPPRRTKAPSLDGGVGWINTASPIDLKDLKGKFVVLDFWTYCCINCIHVLPELKKLEKAYPNEVVVIGVHSAKFEGEQDSQNITDAVLRYEIEHPVVNDAEMKIWRKYGVQSWPSFRIIDPEGYLIAGESGEVQFEVFDGFFQKYIPIYRERKLLNEEPIKWALARDQAERTPLRFPGKVLADEKSNRLFISDSNHNRIVITTLDGKLSDLIGMGAAGTADGEYRTAQFDHPQGMALDGETLYVADTENHLLRKVDLKNKQVTTIAGTGEQARGLWPGMADTGQPFSVPARDVQLPDRFVGPPKSTALNSPWALYIHNRDLYIAMAGPHQIWKMPLDESETGPYAGNGREDIRDGKLLPRIPYDRVGYSSFAQPSGLTGDDNWLYVADSEGSAIRAVSFDPKKEVRTIVGTLGSLFTFGDVDGKMGKARLQHALGVVHHEGLLYVADTYNNKIKIIDPKERTSETFVGTGDPGASDSPAQFDEPAGITYAAGKLFVADTNNHLIRTVDLKTKAVATLAIPGLESPMPEAPKAVANSRPTFRNARQVKLEPTAVKAVDGKIRLRVALELPERWKMNPLAPSLYLVEATNEQGVVDRAAIGKPIKMKTADDAFEISLPVSGDGSDEIRVSMNYFYCKGGPQGICKTGSVVWTAPLQVSASAKGSSVVLPLAVQP
jgi:thiol-disulfide isomerase/thioredoxin/sugar lactone lactonase YvrE